MNNQLNYKEYTKGYFILEKLRQCYSLICLKPTKF